MSRGAIPGAQSGASATPADVAAAIVTAEAYSDAALTAYAALTGHVFARKTANQNLTESNVTPENVTDLLLPLAAGRIYIVEAFIIADSNDGAGGGGTATVDLKVGWAGTNVTSFEWLPNGLVASSTGTSGSLLMNYSSLGSTRTYGIQPIGTGKTVATPRGILVMGGSPGSLQLQAAQGVSEAVKVTVYANSFLRATPVA